MYAPRIRPLLLIATFVAASACGDIKSPDTGDVDADPGNHNGGQTDIDAGPDTADAGADTADAGPDTTDVDPPETYLDDVPASPINQRSATISFHASEPDCQFFCREGEGASFSLCTSPVTVDATSDGPQSFAVYAVDPAHNVDPTPATHAWLVDTTPPVVTISTGPNNPTAKSTGDFSFSANEPVSFECVLDGVSNSCTSPVSRSGFKDGNHAFQVVATDAAGNVGDATWSWVVDAAAPSIQITSKPPLWTNSRDANFVFSTEAGATVDCSMDSTTVWKSCDSATTMAYAALTPNTEHMFRVRATDGVGNQGVASYAWNIDTVAPVVNILNKPVDPTNQTSAAFTFSVGEVSTIACTLNGASSACDTDSSMSYGSVPANQSNTFTVTATDQAGNQGSDTYTWTVDTQPPDTTIKGAPTKTYPIDYITLTLSADDPKATFLCRVNGVDQDCTSTLNLSNLGYGPVKVEAWAVDALGNTDPTPAVATWTNTPGLILYYKFDKNLLNSSPLGKIHDGAGSGFTYGTNRTGAAIQFGSTTQSLVKFAKTVKPMSNDDAYTIGMFVNEPKAQTDSQKRYLFSFEGKSGGISAYRESSLKNELHLHVTTDTGATNSTAITLAPQTPVYMIFESTAPGAAITVYINDKAVGLIRSPGGNVFSTGQLASMVLGANSDFIVDDLKVYNRTFDAKGRCTEVMGWTWDPIKGACTP